ncbi:MAG: right-handed parallel beta-helix repeat-containing protein [Bryobacteraceae bacterium]
MIKSLSQGAIFILLSLTACGGRRPAAFYVALNGNDQWSGKLAEPASGNTDGPFATLERAREAVRALKSSGDFPVRGVVVTLRGGVYRRTETFRLAAEDSGTEAGPVVWRGKAGEPVRLAGGQVVRDFERVRDPDIVKRFSREQLENILVADLRAQGITEYGEMKAVGFGKPGTAALELFFDGKPMQRARYPNEGWLQIASVPQSGTLKYEGEDRGHSRRFGMPLGRHYGRFEYPGDRPNRWLPANDMWMHGYWSWDWNDQYQRIARLDKGRREIHPAEPYHGSGYTKLQRFYFLNILEELDSPGEYYLDSKKGLLYFWPPQSPQGKEALVSMLEDWLVSIDGASHVSFEGITFEASRGGGVIIQGGAGNKVAGCTLRNMGAEAVQIAGGTRNGVLSSDIHGTDAGIVISGGDLPTLTPGRNYATNNHIHDYSRIRRTYQAAVILEGVGQKVSHNHIHHAPHNGVLFNGAEHVLEFNEVHHVAMETGDVGAFYIVAPWTHRGNMIRHNYFHDIVGPGYTGASAVYLDDWTSGTTVYGNVFAGVKAVVINGGRENLIENNVFLNCSPAVRLKSIGLGWAKDAFLGGRSPVPGRLAQIKYKEPPWSTRYPELMTLERDDPAVAKHNKALRNVSHGGRWLDLWDGMDFGALEMRGNLIADPELAWRQKTDYFYTDDKNTGKIKYEGLKLVLDTKVLNGDAAAREALLRAGNLVIEGDPGFADGPKGRLELSKTSKAYEMGFQRIPLDKIGLYADEYLGSKPKGER